MDLPRFVGKGACRCLALAGILTAFTLSGPTVAPAQAGKRLLVAPIGVEGVGEVSPGLSTALTQGLIDSLRRVGATVLEAPAGGVPAEGALLGPEQLAQWAGPDAVDIDILVVGEAAVAREQITLTLTARELTGGQEPKIFKAGGHLNRLPFLLVRLVGSLTDWSGISFPREDREMMEKDFSSSIAALDRYGRSFSSASLGDRVMLLQEAVSADARFTTAWMQLGLALYAGGRQRQAEETFLRVVELNPRFKEAYNNLGVLLSERGEAKLAVKAFRSALEVAGGYFDARFNLAKLLDRERLNEEALEEYGALVKMVPGNDEIRFRMALVLDRLGRNREALEEFRRLSASGPEFAEGFFLEKGRVARQERRSEEARSFFLRALDINPGVKEAYRELGITSFMAGAFAESLEDFRRASREMPDSGEVQHYLGLAALKLGYADEAVQAFTRAIDLENFKESSRELGAFHFQRGNYAEAVGHLERFLKSEPDNEEARDLLARATRKAREEAEIMQKKADFASHRLDKMESIVSDLTRKNSELETRLSIVSEQAGRYEEETARLREEKMALESELSRRMQESGESLKVLSQQLGEMRALQDQRVAALEQDLAKAEARRREAEDNLTHMVERLKQEGTVTIQQGAGEEEVAEYENRLAELAARLEEAEASLEESRGRAAVLEGDRRRIEEEKARELAELEAAWDTAQGDVATLESALQGRIGELEARLEEEESRAAELAAGLLASELKRFRVLENMASRQEDVAALEGELDRVQGEWRQRYEELAADSGASLAEGAVASGEAAAAILELNTALEAERGAGEEARREAEGLAAARDELLELQRETRAALEELVSDHEGRARELEAATQAWKEKELRLAEALENLERERRSGLELKRVSDELRRQLSLTEEARDRARRLPDKLEGELEISRGRLREVEKRSKDREMLLTGLLGRLGQLAERLRREGAAERAAEIHQLILGVDPENVSSYRALGDIYRELNQPGKSRRMFEKAEEYAGKERK